MVKTANLGFPRIGLKRELKKALEAYWQGDIKLEQLQKTGKSLRAKHWKKQKQAGLDIIPSNDFSFYDHILDMSMVLGNIPQRYRTQNMSENMDIYFAMARGNKEAHAMEMTKWFDTNYHYIVPEVDSTTEFHLADYKPVHDYLEAKELGIETRPVIIGPVTYLLLSKSSDKNFEPLSLLPKILPVYKNLLKQLEDAGVTQIQIDEPALVLDLNAKQQAAFCDAYDFFKKSSSANLILTTYFDNLGDNTQLACSLPVAGLHIDCVKSGVHIETVLQYLTPDKILSLGLIDGRNIWKNNLDKSYAILERVLQIIPHQNIQIAPSCSLIHTPIDVSQENALNAEIKSWLAFAVQKCDEVVILGKAIAGGDKESLFLESRACVYSRQNSQKIHNPQVKERLQNITPDMEQRPDFAQRIIVQETVLDLPMFPTTTIGSFPQTHDIRTLRADFKKGTLSPQDYQTALQKATTQAIAWQEEAGLDVLVHGEFERNDMVEYFGEQLEGYCFTKNGWVQSYGSRYVKPPIIFGDIARPNDMTVAWSVYAQSQTNKIVKGMLTGPITMTQWAFVRDDQPRFTTVLQMALALRDEVIALEEAGIKIIQIDEAALREGLPLKQKNWQAYLDNAVKAFKLCSSSVKDYTQIHTHMCYSEFNDIMQAIADLDADVISIETSRSQMELLDGFARFKYPNQIGPGVYDIHSPRIPSTESMVTLLQKACEVFHPAQLWVNPDCGLKTRGWAEVKPALENMVACAKQLRLQFQQQNVA